MGKTAYAIDLARRLGTEVLSCDSRQFYRELNIGVARPDPEELAAVPHHFIACRSVTEPYDVYRYEQDALRMASNLLQSCDAVVAVGGSSLYIQALMTGISPMPDPPAALRQELKQLLADEGIEALRRRLKELDPQYYARVDQSNPARLQRALEVCLTTGRPYSEVLQAKPAPRPFATKAVVLEADTNTLRRRIGDRVEQMMARGLLDEVCGLAGLRHLNTLNTVGYRELFAYLDGEMSLQDAVEAIKTNTWHYAKKQMTWCKKYLADAEKVAVGAAKA